MKKSQDRKYYWLFLLPCLIALTAVIFLPFFYGIYTSFTDSDGFNMTFIGIENYIKLAKDKSFLSSIWFTVRFALVSVIGVNVIGLGLGLLVTRRRNKLSTFFRTSFFVPNLIGGIILGFIWQFIFIQVFEGLAKLTGLSFFEGWLASETTGFWALVIVFLWQMSGYIMIIYISFLNNIPYELIEAARIDGANSWQTFWKVKFRLLAPAFTISLFLTLANAFKVYDLNLALTNGGPFGSTEMVAMNIYNTAFKQYHQGYAQAKGIIYLLLIAAVSLTQMYFSRKREVDL
ncbi:carbohydrate ABC transporter permease [Pisciglobus halotolerans]|uniref:Carbohydrate ABC transporter membrane protein 1, CUT1 family n=1 Tax=Pisciglobus halotolerans TaxID=745365 RepID=A0A1I3DEP6_9LACT|nr:sugar ABC transporter permease [Pisciglobus halotolerans]SFH85059.1 carbohydrate ABC transporter membrane protein 1, CUT1 family [Pisciglobus halotolerans]